MTGHGAMDWEKSESECSDSWDICTWFIPRDLKSPKWLYLSVLFWLGRSSELTNFPFQYQCYLRWIRNFDSSFERNVGGNSRRNRIELHYRLSFWIFGAFNSEQILKNPVEGWDTKKSNKKPEKYRFGNEQKLQITGHVLRRHVACQISTWFPKVISILRYAVQTW